MMELDENVISFCINKLNLEKTIPDEYKYKSLSVCIIDTVYSLQLDYYKQTVPVIDNYAYYFMNNDKFSACDKLSDFIKHIDQYGVKSFSLNILKSKYKWKSNGKYVYRIQICKEISELLNLLGIETINDFRNVDERILAPIIKSVSGIKDAACNYLFMLAGNQNKCKMDVHIRKFINDFVNNCILNNDECNVYFNKLVNELNNRGYNLTVRELDYKIWLYYKNKSN